MTSPKCKTCDGEGAVSGFPDTPWEQCPDCRGAGALDLPTALEASILTARKDRGKR